MFYERVWDCSLPSIAFGDNIKGILFWRRNFIDERNFLLELVISYGPDIFL
jgi:hypothetical protein